MAAIPYMPFFVADYLADAAHLTTLEHGAYLLLIFNYWQRGKPLPDNDKKLARICGLSDEEWAGVRPELEEFFRVDGEEWRHKRIEAELEFVREKSEKAREAGKASAKKRSSARSTPVQRPSNGRSSDAQPSEAYLERKQESPPTPPPGGDPPDPPPGLDLKAWNRWVAYRKDIRKPVKPASIPAAQRKLAALGADQAEAVEESIANGWQGFFPPKTGGPSRRQSAGEPEVWT